MDQSMSVLDWMEQSALGVWVSQSPYGYYLMLGFHSVGLAMLVGIVYVIDLRILGLVRRIAPASLDRLLTIGMWGLFINALSGVAVFVSEANKAYYSSSFRWKMALVVVGTISAVILRKTALKNTVTWPGGEAPAGVKAHAVISIAIWTATIIVGRMMAYFEAPQF